MSTSPENVQYFTNKFYEKANDTFLSKEDGIKGIILGQDWELVDSVVANNTITLPSIDTINEIHIEVQSNDATIVHQVTITKDSLLFDSTNTTHREILVDSIFDVQTFVTYNIADNTITLTSYEGVDVDDNSTTITTKVYIKKMSIADGTFSAERLSYDNSASGLSANNVQDAIDEILSNTSSGGGVKPLDVVNPSLKVGNGKIAVLWSDPEDTIIDGTIMAEWQGTKLVYKVGAYPTNVNDGTLAVDNQVKDQYKTNGFTINNLTNGETYYFALFPYSTDGVVNTNEENRLSGSPQAFRVMTVVIDQSNSNPETCITYADDANSMAVGSSEWDSFFGHYPCLFKDGVEVGRLNPNDFTKFEDGADADITSGNAGDVMIAFPKLGYKISTSGDIVTVSMTDNPNAEGYCYLAHTRGTTVKDVFYLGAYKGYVTSSKLRSLSGKTPTVNTTIGNFRTQAQANGSGYDQSAFNQLVYIQCMYLLKYKNLDSQTAVGQGYTNSNNSSAISTGGTNTKGMDYGETTGTLQMKLFGLEDFWGNVYEWIDGIFSDSSRNILTATENFNDTGSGYTNRGASGFSSDTGGYMSKVQGTSEMGFILKEKSGSSSTYYCDYGGVYASRLACFGGYWNSGANAGAFRLSVNYSASDSYSLFSARLMYL